MTTATAVRERPILFNTQMVQAILEDRKTQTRRFYKGEPPTFFPSAAGGNWGFYGGAPKLSLGGIGDRLWVRETWGCPAADHPLVKDPGKRRPTKGDRIVYQANDADAYQWQTGAVGSGNFVWRPNIHMPRWACRLELEITAWRIEPLKEITQADAIAEGCTDGGCLNCGNSSWPEPCGCTEPEPDHRDSFARLWDSIYGECSWAANPWVEVYKFKRLI